MKHRFASDEPCAINPKAFGWFFDPPPPPQNERRGDVVVIDVRGPLMHHTGSWCDSYDAIKARTLEALASNPKSIVMSIDSPGGLVSGCFDTTDEIRAACELAGVPLYAFVDGNATSAAYALACAASTIVVPPTGTIGSIGCIAEMVSFAKLDAAMGVDRRLVVSGARKGDGHPGAPISDGAEAATQAQVDQLAGLFFEHVARARPMSSDEVQKLEAGIFVGAQAVPALADSVMTLDEMLAAIAAGTLEGTDSMKTKNGTAAATSAESDDKDSPYSKARAALQAVVDDDKADEKEKDKAKAALAAMDGDDETEADAPSTDDDADKDKKNDKDAKALAARLDKIEADNAAKAAKAEADERATLIASRPDLDDSTKKLLATAPIEQVRDFVKTSPKRTPKLGAAAAGVVVTATRGEGQGGTEARGSSELQASLAEAMGVTKRPMRQPTSVGTRQTFPAMTRSERVAWLKSENEKKAKASAPSAS